jgi:UDP-N-acetylglucosamine--N-acetylmuramyl-(pentapeptide) pyrophosphoryl-undecaprenol N-acetylglucosamine transferase
MNAVIACGGTGGHLFPGLAVAEALRARGHEVLLFISEKEIDTLALEGRAEFRFEKLPTVALPSPFSPAILAFVRRFNDSLSVCRGIFRKFDPQVVLGMGGFTSTAPVLAGRLRRIPTFIHESNAFPGKANRYTARFVRAVLLGFKECAAFFPKARTEFTGTPIRSTLQVIDRAESSWVAARARVESTRH